MWADEQKRRIRGSDAWHYVDVPLDEPRYDARFSRPDPKHGCIVDKIHEFANILGNPEKPVKERREALWFIVHLVGDLHQPLHVGDNRDRGGNDTQVRFIDQGKRINRGSNMHRVWDFDIIDWAGDSRWWMEKLTAIDTPENRAASMRGSIEDWATESLLAARQAYQDPATGMRIKTGAKLDNAYHDASVPVVTRRLYEGGLRLAMLLNELLSE
jgi:hypothetical protein